MGDAKVDQAQAMFSKDIAVRKQARPTAYPHLDLIGADASLRGLDQLFHDLDKRKRLAKLLSELAGYDRVILDCPPGLTETADQVMRAADLIVIPVIPSPLSTRAYDAVVQHLGGRTALLPVHVMVDKRRALHAEALARHPDWPVVPMASGIESMAVKRAPVGVFAPRSAAAHAFADLWRQIEHRLAA
jgi:chromosome partitioning protein